MAIKVAVIGAGAAGLACARCVIISLLGSARNNLNLMPFYYFRRLKENPEFSFVVYEQVGEVGGTWVYDERTGIDEYGIPIHTSMYRSLRYL